MAFNIPFKTVQGANIGDIVLSMNSTLEDGKVLLPLSNKARILTNGEQTLYPSLALKLPTYAAFTTYPYISHTAMSIGNKSSYDIATTANGNIFYTDDDVNLIKYDKTTDVKTTVIAGATSDVWYSVACSADGTVVAAIHWDSSNTQYILRVSTDSGASFGQPTQGSVGAAVNERGSVHVSADGTVVAAVLPDGANGIKYTRIDNPVASLTPDVDISISANLPNNTSLLGDCQASFSEDGTKFVITYSNSAAVDELTTAYTEDSGASFTRINAYPLDRQLTVAFAGLWYVIADSNDFNRMVLIVNGSSESFDLFYSQDKGVTWQEIPSPDHTFIDYNSDVSVNGGWSGLVNNRPRMKNGYFLARTLNGFHYLVHIPSTGIPIVLDKLTDKRAGAQNVLGMGWETDNQSFAIAGTTGSNEYPLFGGIMTLGKYIPAVRLFENMKLVADAQ